MSLLKSSRLDFNNAQAPFNWKLAGSCTHSTLRNRAKELEYSEAMKAYQERLPVVCMGDSIKEGNIFVLKNSRHFVLNEALTD